MDRIVIEGFVCYAYHGVLPEETSLGQEFQVSIELGTDLSKHSSDRIDQVPDYRKAVVIIEEVMYGETCQLLETLACRIADRLLKLEGISEATVEVRKPNPPIPGIQGGIGVIITRRK
ncbi:MAG: dihydroneopterin aldolase [Bacillota bacterium]|nr:dihydroneopterin aldolase [Bacillota bacterium]